MKKINCYRIVKKKCKRNSEKPKTAGKFSVGFMKNNAMVFIFNFCNVRLIKIDKGF